MRDPNIYAVVIGSAAQQTFCAGGDLRELAEWGRTAKGKAQASLAAEYALNWRLECFTKPTISLIDGLVREFLFELRGGNYKILDVIPKEKTIFPPACKFA